MKFIMGRDSTNFQLAKNINRLSEDDIIINDILKDRDQKEWPNVNKELNSKSLKFLKKYLKNRTTLSEIEWMDVGCGDGRCIALLSIFKKSHQLNRINKIRYLGIDIKEENMEKAKAIAKNFPSCKTDFLELDAKDIHYFSRFDIISAILFIHEVKLIFVPRILWNLLNALNDDGRLLLSDFNDPYEQEKEIVIWNRREIIDIIEGVGGLVERFELIESDDIQNLYFYNLCIKKRDLDKKNFKKFYIKFYDIIKKKLKNLLDENTKLDEQLKIKIKDILGSDIPAKKLTVAQRKLIRENLSDADILAHRRKMLNHDQLNILIYYIFILEDWIKVNYQEEENKEENIIKDINFAANPKDFDGNLS